MSTYTVQGVTYDEATGKPVSFDENTPSIDFYTGPKNAQVGAIQADNGETYGVYADYNQNHNEIQDSSGNVIYKDFSQFQEGQFPDGVDPSTLSSDDIVKIQSTMGEAGASQNIKDPTYGTGIPNGAVVQGSGMSQEAKNAAAEQRKQGDVLKHLEFGQVDHILQRLSLRNL